MNIRYTAKWKGFRSIDGSWCLFISLLYILYDMGKPVIDYVDLKDLRNGNTIYILGNFSQCTVTSIMLRHVDYEPLESLQEWLLGGHISKLSKFEGYSNNSIYYKELLCHHDNLH